MSDLLIDYCAELIKTQYLIRPTGSNDPKESSQVAVGSSPDGPQLRRCCQTRLNQGVQTVGHKGRNYSVESTPGTQTLFHAFSSHIVSFYSTIQ